MIKEIVLAVGVPVARSVFGWADKALEDGKVEKFELRKLFATVVRVGTYEGMAFVGLGFAGVDNAVLAAGVAAYAADIIIKLVSKLAKK